VGHHSEHAVEIHVILSLLALALAEQVEVISVRAVTVITDEETGRVLTVGDSQDILDARAPGIGST
jgi:hypothetical protein